MLIDALRRFTPTPLEHSFELHGAIVGVATNHQLLASRLLSALVSSSRGQVSPPAFTWRVVVEPDDDLEIDIQFVNDHCISQNGLILVTIGQKSFLAWDKQAHQGVSFVSERLVSDEQLFRQYLLPALISLPRQSIGFTSENGQ